MNPCTRCSRVPRLKNSEWCRVCWQVWWKSIEVLGVVRRAEASLRNRHKLPTGSDRR